MPALLDEQAVCTALAEPAVWPDFSQAAGIVGLTKSTLSKRANAGQIEYQVLGLGRGRHVLSPWEVLRIGSRYHRVPEETLVERLTIFLSPRLDTESRTVRRALLRLLDERVAAYTISTSRKKIAAVRRTEKSQPDPDTGSGDVPSWLLEAEELRENPAALAGCFSFVSPGAIIGHVRLGPSIDDVPDVASTELLVR